MRTPIEWAELHAPLFLAGTNLGMKLPSAEKKHAIKMEYDEERRHLYVSYSDRTCRIPETSVLSMVEAEKVLPKIAVNANVAAFNPNPTAQVETPQSHVFAGPGSGQTGQEPPKRGPGRPKGT